MMAKDSLNNILAPTTIDQLLFVNIVNMSSSRRGRKTENASRRTQPETETRQHYPGQHVPNAQQGHPLPGVPPPPPPHRGDPLRKGSIAEGVFAYKIQEVEPSDKNMGGSTNVTTVDSN